MASHTPIKVFSARPIEAALWPKEQNGKSANHRYDVKVTKSYQDPRGWHHTNRFNVDDLPKVILVTEAAYRFLALREFNPGGGQAKVASVGKVDN